MPGLSRRGFLAGAAGLGAALAVPRSGSSRAPAAVTPLSGATIFLGAYGLTSYLKTAQVMDGYVGLPLATTIEKVFVGTGTFPATPGPRIKQLASAGCQFLISVQPSLTLSASQQTAMLKYLNMLTGEGITYRAALFSEANDSAFTSKQEWQTYWSYYAPVIQSAGVSCAYLPGCNANSIRRAQDFFPSSPAPDELWLDYYATAFRSGVRIDKMIALAKDIGISVGVAEWGWHAGGTALNPMTMPWWTLYCDYLARLADSGDLQLGTIYFSRSDASLELNVIGSASDPRVPGIRQVASAVQAG